MSAYNCFSNVDTEWDLCTQHKCAHICLYVMSYICFTNGVHFVLSFEAFAKLCKKKKKTTTRYDLFNIDGALYQQSLNETNFCMDAIIVLYVCLEMGSVTTASVCREFWGAYFYQTPSSTLIT